LGKTKQKQKSEIEYLKGIINGLKKENKVLKAQLGKSVVIQEDEDSQGDCQVCGKGEIVTLDLKFIKIHTCNVCGSTKKERHK
jgi:hypothetical protein